MAHGISRRSLRINKSISPYQDNVQKAVTERAAQWNNAELSLLRLAIDSIPQALDTPQTFSLRHPDFNYQNIFTNDASDITGLIDWDGVQTLPRALGFARYPSWITRDWDPVKYGYGEPGWRDEFHRHSSSVIDASTPLKR